MGALAGYGCARFESATRDYIFLAVVLFMAVPQMMLAVPVYNLMIRLGLISSLVTLIFLFQAEDGIRDLTVTGVQTCALPIYELEEAPGPRARSVVLGEIAAGLAHQPCRGVLRRLAKQCPQQRVVLQTSFPMYVHSPSVTGVIEDRKSTRLNSSHSQISYAVFCLKKKKK